MSDSAAFPGNHIDGDSSRQDGGWTLEHGASMDETQTTPSLPLAELAAPEVALAWDCDVRRDTCDFVSSSQQIRPVFIGVTLSVVLAVGLVGGFQFLVFAPASTAIRHKPDCSEHALVSDAIGCVAPKSDREAIRSAPKIQMVVAPAAITGSSGHEPPRSTTQKATASTNIVTLATQRKSPGPRAVVVQRETSFPRQALVPETKPGTIEGWTVQEVDGGTAVLEGPSGQWRAISGDTVPGLGKINSIVHWGSRWIVATSKGLVSTP